MAFNQQLHPSKSTSSVTDSLTRAFADETRFEAPREENSRRPARQEDSRVEGSSDPNQESYRDTVGVVAAKLPGEYQDALKKLFVRARQDRARRERRILRMTGGEDVVMHTPGQNQNQNQNQYQGQNQYQYQTPDQGQRYGRNLSQIQDHSRVMAIPDNTDSGTSPRQTAQENPQILTIKAMVALQNATREGIEKRDEQIVAAASITATYRGRMLEGHLRPSDMQERDYVKLIKRCLVIAEWKVVGRLYPLSKPKDEAVEELLGFVAGIIGWKVLDQYLRGEFQRLWQRELRHAEIPKQRYIDPKITFLSPWTSEPQDSSSGPVEEAAPRRTGPVQGFFGATKRDTSNRPDPIRLVSSRNEDQKISWTNTGHNGHSHPSPGPVVSRKGGSALPNINSGLRQFAMAIPPDASFSSQYSFGTPSLASRNHQYTPAVPSKLSRSMQRTPSSPSVMSSSSQHSRTTGDDFIGINRDPRDEASVSMADRTVFGGSHSNGTASTRPSTATPPMFYRSGQSPQSTSFMSAGQLTNSASRAHSLFIGNRSNLPSTSRAEYYRGSRSPSVNNSSMISPGSQSVPIATQIQNVRNGNLGTRRTGSPGFMSFGHVPSYTQRHPDADQHWSPAALDSNRPESSFEDRT